MTVESIFAAAPIHGVILSPDGCYAAILGREADESVTIWDVTARRRLATPPSGLADPKERRVDSWDEEWGTLRFSPDTRFFATTFGPAIFATSSHAPSGVSIRETATGREVLTLYGPAGSRVRRIAYSPNGRRIAFAGGQGAGKCTLHVCDASDGRRLSQWVAE
jgi:WD40 repeat protein